MVVRVKAQITIFASMVLMLAMALVCTSIKSAVDSTVVVRANMAAALGVESAFANYSRQLADRYGVLFVPSSDSFYGGILSNVASNCDNGQLGGLAVTGITPVREVSPTDNGGSAFALEVVEYMKYGLFSDFAQLLLDRDSEVKKQEKAGEIMDEISGCQEEAFQIEENMLALVKAIDGLDTGSSGFVVSWGSPNAVNGGFLKAMCLGRVSGENLGIDDDRVYSSVKDKCHSVTEVLDEIGTSIEKLWELEADADEADEDGADDDNEGAGGASSDGGDDGDDGENDDGGDDDGGGGSPEYEQLKSAIYDDVASFASLSQMAAAYCQKGIMCCDDYIEGKKSLVEKATAIDARISAAATVLGDDLANGLSEDVGRIKGFDMSDAICDPANMRNQLKSMSPLLDELEGLAESMETAEGDGDYEMLSRLVERAMSAVNKVSYDKLRFDYSGVDFKDDGRGEKLLKEITKTLKNGILGIVVENVEGISKKQVGLVNLATAWEGDAVDGSEGSLKDIVLYDTYVMDKFTNYGEENDEYLDYQVEYVLNGKNNDYDNLYATVLSLSALREGANLVSLFTDAARKEECRTLSMGLFGFTGVPALVVVGQYAIMAAWAYGEALVDVRTLLSGGKVSLVKTKDNWRLGLDGLLAMKLSCDGEGEAQDGLDYGQFLAILLGLEKGTHKYYRTMALMEMWMVKQGNADFRMCGQIYEVEAELSFEIRAYGKSRSYTRTVQYNY
jgi:hypothetical protein